MLLSHVIIILFLLLILHCIENKTFSDIYVNSNVENSCRLYNANINNNNHSDIKKMIKPNFKCLNSWRTRGIEYAETQLYQSINMHYHYYYNNKSCFSPIINMDTSKGSRLWWHKVVLLLFIWLLMILLLIKIIIVNNATIITTQNFYTILFISFHAFVSIII